MSRAPALFILLISALLGFSAMLTPCRADIDYQCLNQCANGGKSTSVCLSDCTYSLKTAKPSDTGSSSSGQKFVSQSADALDNHRILKSPVPIENTYQAGKTKQSAVPTKDWTCMSACLSQVKLYDSCERQCTPSPGKILPTQFSTPNATLKKDSP